MLLPSATLPDPETQSFKRWMSGALCLSILAIYSVEWLLSRHTVLLPEVDLMAWAITIDLVLVVPLLVYAFGVRRLAWSPLTLMPATIAGLVAANLLVPAAKDGVLGDLELLFAPLELALVAAIVWQARVTWRRMQAVQDSSQANPDLRNSMLQSAQQVLGPGKLAEVVASEISMFGYALCWRQPLEEPNARQFTVHQRSGFGLLMGGLTIATIAEIVPVHFLVHYFWSPFAAWVLTLLSVYGGIWVLGHWQAVRRRPCEVLDDALLLRQGLLWDVRVPFEAIALLRRVPASEGPIRGALSLVPAGLPSHHLELKNPVIAQGPYGLSKKVDRVRFFVDDPQRFEEALADTHPFALWDTDGISR